MRCPKCHYISFDSGERCRNCGYEFSLAVDAAALDLPIQTGNEPEGPLADFSLTDLDQPAPAEVAPAVPAPHRAAAQPEPVRRAFTPSELPLFNDRAHDDDAPLVTPPAVPRPPLAVRKSSPPISRPPRPAAEEPAFNLELPDLEEEPQAAAEAPEADAPAGAAVLHPTASLGARLAAGLIDLAILGAVDATVLYFTLKIVDFSFAEILLLPIIPLVAFLLMLDGGYFVSFVAAGGQTIGKMATGIKVVRGDAEPGWPDRVPLGTAFLRAAAFLLSLAPFGAGLLPALFSGDRRTVHDRLANTRVVKA